MKSVKLAIATTALTAAASVLAPPAHAYDAWAITTCSRTGTTELHGSGPSIRVKPATPDCLKISAAPRLKFYDYYDGNAHLANGQWTLNVDVPDGLQCLPGYAMPTHETWTWDDRTLAGTIDSDYDVGCFNGPPGSQFWTFALQRL